MSVCSTDLDGGHSRHMGTCCCRKASCLLVQSDASLLFTVNGRQVGLDPVASPSLADFLIVTPIIITM